MGLKTWEVIKHDLERFNKLEDLQQEILADYFACPSSDDCKYDGYDNSICAECKAKWLNSEWED